MRSATVRKRGRPARAGLQDQGRIRLVDHDAVRGIALVHGLQGGGAGLGGRFIEVTWCGYDSTREGWSILRPTTEAMTCAACIRVKRAAARTWRTR